MNAPVAPGPMCRANGRTPTPLRAVHFISSLGVYGAERWTLALLRHLDPDQVQSTVVTIGTRDGATAFRDLLVKEGYDCVHLPYGGQLSLRAICALRQLVRDRRIDVVNTHGFKSDVIGALAVAGTPARLVATPHGWSADEGWRIRAYERIGRAFLKRFDAIFPLSPALREDFLRWGFPAERVRMILNGVDLSAFTLSGSKQRERTPDDSLRVLFAGRLCRPKGVDDLLHAVARYRALDRRGVVLRVAGDGPQREELDALALDLGIVQHVQFLGSLATIAPQLEWADVLVLPSLSEGVPRTVMEAFAAGVPVIGTDIPGIRVLVKPMITGLLVPVHDPEAIARALATLADCPDLASTLARAARECVEREFSARRMAQEYTGHYRLLCRAGQA